MSFENNFLELFSLLFNTLQWWWSKVVSMRVAIFLIITARWLVTPWVSSAFKVCGWLHPWPASSSFSFGWCGEAKSASRISYYTLWDSNQAFLPHRSILESTFSESQTMNTLHSLNHNPSQHSSVSPYCIPPSQQKRKHWHLDNDRLISYQSIINMNSHVLNSTDYLKFEIHIYCTGLISLVYCDRLGI